MRMPATLLPTRWEFSYRLPSASGTGLGDRVTVPYRFSFDDTLTLAPPAGAVTLPTCVDPALQGR